MGHTESPWVAVHQPPRDAEIATVAWVGDWCVGVPTPGYPGGNYRDTSYGPSGSDAKLIAAAPELLAALQQARGQWIHSVNAPACLAAIAKALGVTPNV